MTDRHLDDAIDRAVREMMSVDAHPGFRARVFARIERTPTRILSSPRVALAATLVAAVVVAAFLARQPPAPAPSVPGIAQAPAASAAPAVQSSPATAPQAAAKGLEIGSPVSRRRAIKPPTPNVTQQVAAGAIVATVAEPEAALGPDEPAATFITPIRITPIEPPPIVIAPLAPLSELPIAPLSPHSRRD